MKGNELKVGNYVYDMEGKIFTIERGAHIEWCEDFNPIPLTEEWLLKFGFECSSDPEDYHYIFNVDEEFSERFVINRKRGFDVFFIQHKDVNDTVHFTTQIKTIHALQNLVFAIIGEELKTKEL